MTANQESRNNAMSPAPEVHIACAINDAYAPHLCVMAASLAATRGKESLRITLLAGPGLGSDTISTIERYLTKLSITLHCAQMTETMLGSLPPSAAYSPIIWYRLFLPELLPACRKVLYLDADTLVLQSLLPLFEEELDTDILGAVAQPTTFLGTHGAHASHDPTSGYFNSGVLLMNLQIMREEGLSERVLKITQAADEAFTFPDQDVLNILTRGRWKKLPPKWNALSYLWLDPKVADDSYSALELAMATYAPAIVHFEGHAPVKPWFFRSVHPIREVYRQFRAQTPWPLKDLEGRSFSTAVLRRFPPKWQYALSRWKNTVLKFVRYQQ